MTQYPLWALMGLLCLVTRRISSFGLPCRMLTWKQTTTVRLWGEITDDDNAVGENSDVFNRMSDDDDDDAADARTSGDKDSDEGPIFAQSTVRVDDGGSDLTDRFKYKVNALMGVFDPQVGDDTERQDGNILNAMLQFPTKFTFTAVGRTSGNATVKEDYVDAVKKIISSLSGDDVGLQCQITPRGKSFTRVSIQVQVDSAAVVNSIYNELEKMELTVMNY